MEHAVDERKGQSVFKGLLCGLIAGELASAAMDCYWWVAQKLPGARPEQKPKGPESGMAKQEPSTQIVADKVSEAITGHEVHKENKAIAGVVVHYAFGIFWGGLFGALAARIPRTGVPAGILYGVGIWLFADEIALRALDIAPDPEKVPLSQHVQALGAHLVYGSAMGLFTRLLLRIFS